MKSFRAAAERIVRQESSSPTDVLRLLGPAVDPARTIASEDDEWDVRLAALAAIGQYDALAFIASKPTRLMHSHNISAPRTLQGAVADAFDEVARRGAAVQLRAPTALADGRVCTEIMVAPLTPLKGVEGVLLALRVGRGFGAADAVTASSVGTVVALEVARAAAALQDLRTLRQSLALFELARIGLGHQDLGERLLVMVEVVARSLGHDVAQLWLLGGGGALRLRAAHPQESLVLEIARPRDHAGLARALDGEVLQVADASLRSWIRRTTRALIIAPLRGGEGVTGLLILGRFSGAYVDDDLDMSRQCAEFFAEIVASEARARGGLSAHQGARLEDALDRELTRS
ncbi:MAG: GAF domain-containing protein [Candidatus Limnocylindria bacterium]